MTFPGDAKIWSKQSGYGNYNTLDLIICKDIVKGLPKLGRVRDNVCGLCHIGKQIKVPHKKTTVAFLVITLTLFT